MESIDKLADQHIQESYSHLKHIDELMAQASASGKMAGSSEAERLLNEIKANRALLAQRLEDLRRGLGTADDKDVVQRSADLRSELQAAGRQFEKAITAIFDLRGV